MPQEVGAVALALVNALGNLAQIYGKLAALPTSYQNLNITPQCQVHICFQAKMLQSISRALVLSAACASSVLACI
jgi:hypothetical protein